jgi:hypothetical protein
VRVRVGRYRIRIRISIDRKNGRAEQAVEEKTAPTCRYSGEAEDVAWPAYTLAQPLAVIIAPCYLLPATIQAPCRRGRTASFSLFVGLELAHVPHLVVACASQVVSTLASRNLLDCAAAHCPAAGLTRPLHC